MTWALVALGSNLAPRRRTLEAAAAALGRLPSTRLVSRAAWRETAPESPGDGGRFLNGAALLETSLGPQAMLGQLLELERRFGRRRRLGRGPRTLDLDLVLHGAARVRTRRVEVPHPRFRRRAFVLEPAVQVAGTLRDPLTGLTLRGLLEQLRRPEP